MERYTSEKKMTIDEEGLRGQKQKNQFERFVQKYTASRSLEMKENKSK